MLLHGISDTSYNLRQRMPPAMVFHAGTLTASSYDICLTYITPWQQVRIKINYNAILAQYLVYCQLIATISILLFFTLYKNFSSICLFLSLYFSKWSERYFILSFPFVLWQLKNIHHHGYWFLMTDSLLMVCPPSGFHRSQSSRRRGREGHRKRWWKVWIRI